MTKNLIINLALTMHLIAMLGIITTGQRTVEASGFGSCQSRQTSLKFHAQNTPAPSKKADPDLAGFINRQAADEMPPGPSEVIADFPALKPGMSFAEAQQAIRAKGAAPISLRDSVTEIAWEGTFDKIAGRGTVLLKESGVYEVAVVAYAMRQQKIVFARWSKILIAKHGAPSEITDDKEAISKVWRLKSGYTVELRMPKDIDSPIVDLHWVRVQK